MKKIKVGPASKLKKTIYIIASIFLGFLLSVIFHSVLEMIYISQSLKNNRSILFYGSCSLHPVIQILIIIAGVSLGYLFGKYWWRKIYIERILDKNKNTYGRD